MIIKLLRDEIVVTSKGPVRLFAGDITGDIPESTAKQLIAEEGAEDVTPKPVAKKKSKVTKKPTGGKTHSINVGGKVGATGETKSG